jgi:hypothetical protein
MFGYLLTSRMPSECDLLEWLDRQEAQDRGVPELLQRERAVLKAAL